MKSVKRKPTDPARLLKGTKTLVSIWHMRSECIHRFIYRFQQKCFRKERRRTLNLDRIVVVKTKVFPLSSDKKSKTILPYSHTTTEKKIKTKVLPLSSWGKQNNPLSFFLREKNPQSTFKYTEVKTQPYVQLTEWRWYDDEILN